MGTKYINTEKITDRVLFDKAVWDDVRIPGLSVEKVSNAPDNEAFGPSGGLLVPAFIGYVWYTSHWMGYCSGIKEV